jgi:hypothetical protein
MDQLRNTPLGSKDFLARIPDSAPRGNTPHKKLLERQNCFLEKEF